MSPSTGTSSDSQWTISQEQVEGLLSLSGGPNNRPVQPTGDRVITIGGAP